MTAPDQIKAGKYELVVLSWDQTTSKTGEPYSYKRWVEGDIVTLDVEEARRMVVAGAVVLPGERQKAAVAAAKAQLAAALAALPDDLRDQVSADLSGPPAAAPSVAPTGGPSTPAAPVSQPAGGRPAGNASLEAWSDYAVMQGATVEELEGLSRDEIRALYPQA